MITIARENLKVKYANEETLQNTMTKKHTQRKTGKLREIQCSRTIIVMEKKKESVNEETLQNANAEKE